MRGRRVLTGLDAVFSAVLAVALLGILNYLAHRYDRGFDWTREGLHSLDPRTANLLKDASGREEKVRVAVFSAPRYPWEVQLMDRVGALLERYKASCPSLDIVNVDFYNAPQQAKALADEFSQGSPEANSVVFKCGDRVKSVSATEMAEPDFPDSIRAFKAEDAFTTALRIVLLTRPPRILFVEGQGERSLKEEQSPFGYLLFQSLLERTGLPPTGGPLGTDPLEGRWDLVVVAGPTNAFSQGELDRLHQYFLKGGKLLLLLDPLIAADRKGLVPTGLESLVSRWGLRAPDELVIDPKRGHVQDGKVLSFIFSTNAFAGDSRITQGMGPQTPVAFWVAQPVELAPEGVPPGIRASSLVQTERSAWAKRDLRDLVTGILKPEPSLDRPGPHSLAVQASVHPEDIPAKLPEGYSGPAPLPSDAAKGGRAVVIGDADFAASQVLDQSRSNQDFLLNACYWLLDQEGSMGISAKSDVVSIVLEEEQVRQAYYLVVWGVPLGFLAAGLLVWWVRRN